MAFWYIYLHRGWYPKFATGLNIIIGCSSKSIRVTRLLFCQNDSLRSYWQKDSLITRILFELQPIMIFSPVTNFGYHPLISYLGLKQTTRFGILNWVLKIWHFFMTWMLVGGIYFGLRHLVTQTIRSRVNYPMVTSLANLEQDHLLELNKPEKWNTWNLPIFFFLKIDSTFI